MTTDAVAGIRALLSTHSLPPISERVRLRRAGGFTQAQVAQAIGVRHQQVFRWERGLAEPRGKRREAYAELLRELAQMHPLASN
ncbi:helix-turn-helix domain-containing protein [Streptomyces sp. ZAF1911]|uniref:helix-turn-helix domain-containing protein n=1 Tax=Streptomyces sp. ZAF1911 TaxID=2944129 RepID=UPI00237A9DDC|nr:helix-turn-helix domain-containing protein [Streptomyces sp. ZAF1911]MDD9383142.1 helix-turn-helix domain-containing protein [Streptomyces sp. ZAF1911]